MLKDIKKRLNEERPAMVGGGSMIGENMKDYMIDSPKRNGANKGANSTVHSPTNQESLEGSADSKKNKEITSALIKKARTQAPATAKVGGSFSSGRGKKGFGGSGKKMMFNFDFNDIAE